MSHENIPPPFSYLAIVLFTVFYILSVSLKAQPETINLPNNNDWGGTLCMDILHAEGKILVYSGDGVLVYNASDNSYITKLDFNMDYGKFNPVYFNSRMFVPDQNLMVFNDETSYPYVYVMLPDMDLMIINLNDLNNPWFTSLEITYETSTGTNTTTLKDLYTSQNGRCIMRFDDINKRFYLMTGGRDLAYQPNQPPDPPCLGNFHYRMNVMSIFDIDYNKAPDEAGHFLQVFCEANGKSDGDYDQQVNNFVFDANSDKFFLVRLGSYDPYNIYDSYSIVDLYDLSISNTDPIDTFIWEVPGSRGYHKIGKVFKLNFTVSSQTIDKVLVFPYKYPSGSIPNPEFLILDWSGSGYETISCPSDRINDAIFLDDGDDLLLSYSPTEDSQANLAQFHFNPVSGNLELEYEWAIDASPLSSDYDYNASFEFTKLSESSTLLGKKDGIAMIEYDNLGDLDYSTLITREGNFYRKGAAYSVDKAYLLNTAAGGLEIYNGGSQLPYLRTAHPVHHITSNRDGTRLYCYNKLNTHRKGISVMKTDVQNETSTILHDVDAAIGDCTYNPFQDHILVSLYEPNSAIVKVYDANDQSHVGDIDVSTSLPGASFIKEIFISPNGRIYVCANMIYGETPSILCYDASDYTQFYEIEDITIPGLLLGGYENIDMYSARFDYDFSNDMTYACVSASENKLPPYGIDHSSINYLTSVEDESIPGILKSLNGISEDDEPLSAHPTKVICPDKSAETGSSQYDGLVFTIGDKFYSYDFLSTTDGLDEYDEPFIDILYLEYKDQLYAFRDVAGIPENCTQWRKCEIYKVNNISGTMNFSIIDDLTIDGQISSAFFNPYDGRIYVHQKVDHEKLGQAEMKLLSYDPESDPPGWEETDLGMSTYFPDYDNTSDPSRMFYYSLTTPYINQYANSIYLPNGGHSCISKVSFIPDENLLLNNKPWAWVSFPRLERDGGNPSVHEVLYGTNGERIETLPVQMLYDDYSELQNLIIGELNPVSNVFLNFNWPATGELTHIDSKFGYKLNLEYDPEPDQKWVHLFGDVIHPDDAYIYLEEEPYENWVGYYLYQEQFPPDALSEDDLDHIYLMKGQYWACAKDYTDAHPPIPYWVCKCAYQNSTRLSYGDLVILKSKNPINNFRWHINGLPPSDNLYRPETENYTFNEQADYTPIFIELDSTENPLEIGAFVEDSCVGATSVFAEDTLIMVPAYTEGFSGEVYFETYYGSIKSDVLPIDEYLVRDNKSIQYTKRMIHTAEKQDYYFVSFKGKQGNQAEELRNNCWIKCMPNPIISRAQISYFVPESAIIEVCLFDMFGNKKALIHNGFHELGTYELIFNGIDENGNPLANGPYIVYIRSDKFRAQEKVIIIN